MSIGTNEAGTRDVPESTSTRDSLSKKYKRATRDNVYTMKAKKDLEKKKIAKEISEKINNKKYSIKKLSTENNELYGSVKPTEISKIIYDYEKLEIKPSMIQLIKEIKSLGNFKVKIVLHSEVEAEINIKVIAAETIQ